MIAASWFFAAWLVLAFVTSWAFGTIARIGEETEAPPLSRSIWRAFRAVAAALFIMLAVGLLTGCATMPIPPAQLGRVPTPDEARLLDAFAPPIIAAARLEGFKCRFVSFAISDAIPNDDLITAARPGYNPCDFFVRVNPIFLQHDSPQELAGGLAHELSHVIDRDWTPGRAATPQITREREADAGAIRILRRIGTDACLVMVDHYKRIRAENIKSWGVEQRDTVGTHPSYTERIATFAAGCRAPATRSVR